MLEQAEWLVGAEAEKLCTGRVEHTFRLQLINCFRALVVGVDLDEWLRPKSSPGIFCFNVGLDIGGVDIREAARKCRIFVYELVPKLKDVVHQ